MSHNLFNLISLTFKDVQIKDQIHFLSLIIVNNSIFSSSTEITHITKIVNALPDLQNISLYVQYTF